MMPSQPTRSDAWANATHSAVERPAMPATTGTRPAIARTTVSLMRVFSSTESVAASPREPPVTTPVQPQSTSQFTCSASAWWSMVKSSLNGVVIAGMTPAHWDCSIDMGFSRTGGGRCYRILYTTEYVVAR